MKNWFEVFRTGNHTSSNGKSRQWTEDDLDHMISSYNGAENPAPLVIGHPENNAPVYGWVAKLKRVGNILLALPESVSPLLANLVKDGRYKKRSISVSANGTLKHVGFLGSMPPAVKGLKDIEFFEGLNDNIYEEDFSEDEMIAVEMAAPHQHGRTGQGTLKSQFDNITLFSDEEQIAEEMAAAHRC